MIRRFYVQLPAIPLICHDMLKSSDHCAVTIGANVGHQWLAFRMLTWTWSTSLQTAAWLSG